MSKRVIEDDDGNGFETCDTCVHYVELSAETEQGSCYRYPPTPFPIRVEPLSRVVTGDPKTAVGGDVSVGALYPPVNRKTLSCGEHETDADSEYHAANPEDDG